MAQPVTLRRRLSAAALAASLAGPAAAQSWMDDFYAGATLNVTGAGEHRTQASNIYAGGGFMLRTPNRNYSLLQVTPPTLKGGCGGIDAWLGSFGFINKDQFVQLLRNVGQNALGALFMTAIESLSPELAGVLKYLQDQAAKMNNLTVNSCQLGSQLAGAINTDWMKQRSHEAENIRRETNVATDAFLGSLKSKASLTEAMTAADDATVQQRRGYQDAAGKAVNKTQMNLTWAALDRAPGHLTTEEKRLAMSLLGAVVLVTTDAPEGEGTNSVDTDTTDKVITLRAVPDSIRPADLIGSRTGPTAMQLLRCDAEPECLNPSPEAITTNGFARIALLRMGSIFDKIAARQGQDVEDLKLLAVTSVPVYRLLSAAAQSENAALLSTMLIDYYSDVVAADLADHFIVYLGDQMTKALRTHAKDTHRPVAAELAQIEERSRHLRTELRELRKTAYAAATQRASLITELSHLQQHSQDTMSKTLAANLRFASRR